MRQLLGVLVASLWLAGCQGWQPETRPMPPRPGSAAAEETLTLLDGGWSLGDALVFYEAYYRRGELARIAERISYNFV